MLHAHQEHFADAIQAVRKRRRGLLVMLLASTLCWIIIAIPVVIVLQHTRQQASGIRVAEADRSPPATTNSAVDPWRLPKNASSGRFN